MEDTKKLVYDSPELTELFLCPMVQGGDSPQTQSQNDEEEGQEFEQQP